MSGDYRGGKQRVNNLKLVVGRDSGDRRDAGGRENLIGGVRTRANAVGHANAVETVAGEGETGEFLAESLDALETFEVSDAVLGHGRTPTIDAGKERFGREAQNLPAEDLL